MQAHNGRTTCTLTDVNYMYIKEHYNQLHVHVQCRIIVSPEVYVCITHLASYQDGHPFPPNSEKGTRDGTFYDILIHHMIVHTSLL